VISWCQQHRSRSNLGEEPSQELRRVGCVAVVFVQVAGNAEDINASVRSFVHGGAECIAYGLAQPPTEKWPGPGKARVDVHIGNDGEV
jgi:hypothetical protein